MVAGCPTVYARADLGNAGPVVVLGGFYRRRRRVYGAENVTYVRNITDVEDKIMVRAKENGEPIEALTARTEAEFHDDMRAIGALDPDIEPRATQHIPQMVALIETLIEKGFAYAAEGHALFSVQAMQGYGELSRRSRDEMIAGARVEVAPYKRDPADFVLWKPSNDDQPGWDSPWGRGRPGWHIECSAMSEETLGLPFDIHGGGLDLVFPHHENEIAQTCCANAVDGVPLGAADAFARYWMHNGYLVVEGEKMSKSLGNFFTVRDLLDTGVAGETIRLAMLGAHYRQPLDWREEGVAQAKDALDRFYLALRAVADVESAPSEPDRVMEALADDLNTPLAIAELHELVTALNKAEDADKPRLKGALLAAGELMGLLEQDPEAWLKGGGAPAALPDEEIERLIAQRAEARKAKDFAEADRIRDVLAEAGVALEDSAGVTTWRRAG